MTEIHEFLRNHGAVEILSAIEPGGNRFSELEEMVLITDNTLTKRLGEGQEVRVFKRRINDEGDILYALDERGGVIRREINKRGIDEVYESYKQSHDDFNRRASELATWAEEGPMGEWLDEEAKILIDWLDEKKESDEPVDDIGDDETLVQFLRRVADGLFHNPYISQQKLELIIEESNVDSKEDLEKGEQ